MGHDGTAWLAVILLALASGLAYALYAATRAGSPAPHPGRRPH
jgi:hypothetical protein